MSASRGRPCLKENEVSTTDRLRSSLREMGGDDLAKFGGFVFAGVDDDVGDFAQAFADQFAFVANAVGHGAVERERMAAARFGETAAQHLIVAIEEDDFKIERRILAQGA